MKASFLFGLTFLLINIPINAQEGWFDQASNTTYDLLSVNFIDNNTGWTVGAGFYPYHLNIILKTTDGGTNWNPQTSGTTNYLRSVHFTDNNTGWVVGWGGTILKTTVGGTNWNYQTSGTTYDLLSVNFADNNTGWAVGAGFPHNSNIILKTTDGGTNWNPQAAGTTEELYSVFSTDQITGWVVGESGAILHTTDGGENWNPQTSGTAIALLSVHFTDNHTGWAVGEGGTILKTTNGGVTFIEDEIFTSQPKEFLLSQNYPNPFNPTTTIKYQIPLISFVTIKVYDVLGNEIATLVNEEKPAGEFSVEFRIDNLELSSGIYFYQLRAEDYTETKKMVLLK
jgi:photosystem II stability/assembly factor-like uncharacterized protein